jgi:outer membrane protein OmpA-like peptidoglycan-associated protein
VSGEGNEFRVIRIEREANRGSGKEHRSVPDYYVNGGKAEGVEPSMFFDVYRSRSIQDPFSGESSEIRILIGQVKVLRVFDHLSVVRLYALESPDHAPNVTYRTVMIGDYAVPRADAPRPAKMSVPSSLLFDFSRWQLKPESAPILSELADILTQFPENRLVITGHTCDIGTPVYNQELSLKRAQAVAHYLSTIKGISKDRIQVIGQGEKSPMIPNRTEEDRKKNRRVDFLLVPKEPVVASAQ